MNSFVVRDVYSGAWDTPAPWIDDAMQLALSLLRGWILALEAGERIRGSQKAMTAPTSAELCEMHLFRLFGAAHCFGWSSFLSTLPLITKDRLLELDNTICLELSKDLRLCT